MRTNETNDSRSGGVGLLKWFTFMFLPYWPLLCGIMLFFMTASLVFYKLAIPVYSVHASLLVKDEKKGAEENKVLDALDAYNATKIVENEIEVIRSKDMLFEVAEKLRLYARLYTKGAVRQLPAYSISPVRITVKDLQAIQETDRIPFSFNKDAARVRMEGKDYPVGDWVSTPYGVLRFDTTGHYQHASAQYYMELVPLRKVAADLNDDLAVESANKLSSVVDLEFRDTDPERGEAIMNGLIEAYSNAGIESKNQLAANTLAFVNKRLVSVESQLDSIERTVRNYKSSHAIVDISDQSKLYLQAVSDNDKKVSDINMRLAVLDQVERYIQSKDEGAGIAPSTLGIEDPVLSQMVLKLNESQAALQRSSATTAENNPMVISMRNEVERMRPGILENIQNQRAGLVASRSNLMSSSGSYNAQLQAVPRREQELLEISRTQAIKNNVYDFLLQKREEAALTYASTIPNNRVVEKARASIKPVSPKWFIVLGIGLVLGMIVGSLYVFIRESMSPYVLFRSEIEESVDFPVSGEIPNVSFEGIVIPKVADQEYALEQFRQLRMAIGLYGKSGRRKKLLVTSSIPGEGKSFISSNMAASLARSGKRTLLMDLDFRKPKVTSMFKMEEKIGLADFLEEEDLVPSDIMHYCEEADLFVIPAGRAVENPTDLLTREKFLSLLGTMAETFDYVILDSPPIIPVTDTFLLSEICDHTLYVVRHKYTPKAVLDSLATNSKVKRLKNVSVVFNSIRARGYVKSAYGYMKGYGNEYLYGQVRTVVSNKSENDKTPAK